MNPEELLPDEVALEMTPEAKAHEHMTQAMKLLEYAENSRHNSIAITHLETAMMFNNKDRTLKGELEPYATHTTK